MAETYIIQNLTTTGSSSPSASLVRLGVLAVATDSTHPALYFLKNDGSFAKIIDEANINGNTITLSGYTTTESGQTVVATDTVDIAIAKLVAEIASLKARVVELESRGTTVTTYNITLNGDSNVSFSNLQNSISEGSSYALVVTAATGYELSSVVCTMGGYSQTVTNGVISLPSVTGDIVVTASATPLSYTISKSGSNVTYDNTATATTYGSEYTLNISPSTGYELSSVTVTMNGSDISSSAYSNGKVSIASVTGNVVIIVTTALMNYTVSKIGTGVTYDNSATQASYGSQYEVNISAITGYELSTVTVTMNSVDVTSSVYSDGKVSITSVTGAIVITVTVTEKEVIVSDIGEVTTTDSANQTAISINDGALSSGTYTMRYEDADDNEIATTDDLGTLGIIDEFTI